MFKHSLNVTGSGSTLEKFWNSLISLGYTPTEDRISTEAKSIALGKSRESLYYLKCGEITYFLADSGFCKREFLFNIDNQWEYDSALAIATIHDDNKPHIGEWVVAGTGRKNYTILGDKGSLHKIDGIGNDEESFSVEDYEDKRPDNRITSLDYDAKATPEEIINYFKNLYNQSNTKEIIGYRTPTDLFKGVVPKGTVYLAESGYRTSNGAYGWTEDSKLAYTNMPAEIVETWELVYKEEGFKTGDWVTIVSSAFSLSEGYHIGGTYKLKQDFSPTSGNFLAGPDNRGSNTNGYTSKTTNYFTDKRYKITVRKATKEEIEKTTVVEINGYKPTVENGKIAFGCQKFTKQDLVSIGKLFSEEIKGMSLKIGGVEITASIITKLIAKLEI